MPWRRAADRPGAFSSVGAHESTSALSAEYEFMQTLIGQMSMAFSMVRSSSGGGAAAAAAQSCQELGMCLESLGATRIDAVLVAIER
jgi:hypothetical protein